ncbi:hypothetical protein Tco_1194735 [Tanacetum coccineum]
MVFEVTNASTQQNLEQMDEEFTTTAYQSVQENLKLPTEDQVIIEEPASSAGTLSSLQNLDKELSFTNQFFVEKSQEDSELEQHMADLLQDNLALGERFDKHGTWLYNLENLDIPHKVSQAIDEIVTDAVDWQCKLHYELASGICHCRYEGNTASANDEARKKRRKRRDAPRSPPGSPPLQPPPPPPPAGASGTLDSGNDHTPVAADSRKDWWKPLPKEERSATPEPAWTIPSPHKSDVENNWASMLVTTYEPPAENSLLAKIGDMTTILNSYCQRMNKTVHTKGSCPALLISKMKVVSYSDFGLELLVPEQMWIDDVCTYNISAKYGISHRCFTRQKFYIDRHESLSRRKEVRTHMRILSVVRIKAYSRYGYDYLSEIVLRRANHQEHKIAEKDFKNLYPSDFKDLNLLLLQGHLNHLFGLDKRMLSTAVKLWTRNLVIRQRVEDFQLGIERYQTQLTSLNQDGMLQDTSSSMIIPSLRLLEQVKEFKIKWHNPGMNTHFWTKKDVTRRKEFITVIESRLKTRRIYQNLECFVGGRVRDIDYRLLQRTE